MIASFAVGRTQSLLWGIARLKRAGAIPKDLPVFLNSPMATDVTRIYHDHRREHRLDRDETEAMCRAATIVTSAEVEAAQQVAGPMVIIAAAAWRPAGASSTTCRPSPRTHLA